MSLAPRLILVDLDGTLLGANGEVSDRNVEALTRAFAAGCRVVVATGRPARLLGPIRERLPSPLVICYNGGVVLDLASNEVIESHPLDGDAFLAAISQLREAGVELDAATEGLPDLGFRGEIDFPQRPGFEFPRLPLAELCAGTIIKGLIRASGENFERAWALLAGDYADRLTVTRSGIDGLIEVSGAGISKGKVVDGLAREWGIAPSEAIAFGDMPNDIDMLRWAGISVAMGNAEPAVKDAATEVTDHHDNSGVAAVLERWF